MLDTTCVLVSLFCLVAGVVLMLFPRALIELSQKLEKSAPPPLDDKLLYYPVLRYTLSLLAFAVCLGMFRLAWLLPMCRE